MLHSAVRGVTAGGDRLVSSMRIFGLLTFMLACAQVFSGKIYGGRAAVPHSRPFMALVEYTLPDESTDYCGGFILSEWFVMTAAHCQGSSYRVFLGLHDINEQKDVQKISVDRAFPDREYNKDNKYTSDIMLLKLKGKVKFSFKVQPIGLADKDDGSPENCMLFGWGRHNFSSDELSLVLLEANVTLINNSKCANDSFYCSEGKTGPGKGDSGGPLVCENGKVYGLVCKSSRPNQNQGRRYFYTMISKDLPLVKK